MKHLHQIALYAFLLIAVGLFAAACGEAHEDGDDHTDHAATEAHDDPDDHDDHEGDAHDAEEEGEGHEGPDDEAHEAEDEGDGHDDDEAHEGEDEADPHAGHDHADEAHEAEDEADPHAGHDHADEAHEAEDEDDPHAGHDHDDEAHEAEDEDDGHDDDEAHEGENEADPHAGHDHAEESKGGEFVELTAKQRRRIGLQLAKAGPGRIARGLTFPGEVMLNPDRMAHVVPRAAGVAREVPKTLGDEVEAGEILGWIESAELASAKLAFYDKEAEVGCCELELPRAREIFENVGRLLAQIEKSATEDELQKLEGLEMGEYRGKIISAHAGFVAAKTAFESERTLSEKAVSSGQELVAAKAAFQKARAEFNATVDTARYEVLVAFTEAARKRQVAEFEAVAAEQALRLMGADDLTIEKLRGLVPKTAGVKPCLCPDPDCKDNDVPSVRAKLGAEKRLGWYPLRAPFAGVVIEKHLTLGEKVGDDESVFTLADTSTVWINFGVYQKDLVSVKPGQAVTVEATGGGSSHSGKIAYLAPLLDPETRTANARVVLANEKDALRPGLFVTVRVALPTIKAAVMVPRSAVQILDEKEVVFVTRGDEFEAVPVKLGRGDRKMVEITRGLKAGQSYVKRGAFELKAKIATSGMDAHAGHGH